MSRTTRLPEREGAALLKRRAFLKLAGSAAALTTSTNFARSQAFPSQPIHWISGFAAGGSADVIARLVGQFLYERLGQPVIVEHRPGAAGELALNDVARATPDGYSLLWVNSADAINVTFRVAAEANVVRDIAPISGLALFPNVLVIIPSLPIKTVPEFIAYAKANPGKLNLATAGTGSVVHVAGEFFKMMTHVDFAQVPYKGTAPAVIDLLGGQVQGMFGNLPSVRDHIASGKLRALAVTTKTRLEELPGVPALAEFVAGYEVSTWFGVGAPRKTPSEVIGKLHSAIGMALADRRIVERIGAMGGMPMPMSPDEFGKLIARDADKWAGVIKYAKIKSR